MKFSFFFEYICATLKLTDSQKNIIDSSATRIAIHAVAGSGKSTTLAYFAQARPKHRFLYLVFNRTARLEAEIRFKNMGLNNILVHTAHSLAWSYTRSQIRESVQSKSMTPFQLLEVMEKPVHIHNLTLAKLALNLAGYFCNSEALKVQDLSDFMKTLSDAESRKFYENYGEDVVLLAREYLAGQHKLSIASTHDFYLKMFQLSSPQLDFDWILLDEAQDCSMVMLDIVLKQKCCLALVGDPHQQIYGWRHAVNAFDFCKDFVHYPLNESFRFPEYLANLGQDVLMWKNELFGVFADQIPQIHGKGKTPKKIQTRAVLARTNLGLLTQAFHFLQKEPGAKLWFEGNLASYTYAQDGASLWDIFALKQNKLDKIRDPLLKQFSTMCELEDYIDQSGDQDLSLMFDIVNEFDQDLPQMLNKLKASQSQTKEGADCVFSTIHRSKGLEYDEVTLGMDFNTPDDIKAQVAQRLKEGLSTQSLQEEVNLLYVALTRSKGYLHLPEKMTEHLVVTENHEVQIYRPKVKAVSAANVASKTWTSELDKELIRLYYREHTVLQMAKHFKRTVGAVRNRLKFLDFDL